MAEIFGAVASGAGLVSLSMQLIESTQKLKSFYNASREAPDTVADLCEELQILSMNLRLLESHRQNNILGDELLEICVSKCARMIAKIQTAVDKMGSLMNRSRLAGRLYTAFKEPEIKQLLEEMERAKGSLLTACLSYYHSHSVMEAAKSNAILQAQNEMLLAHRDKLDQIEDRLDAKTPAGFIHPSTPITRIRPTSAEHPYNSDTPNSADRTALQRYSDRPLRRKFRVSLPRWFTNCVWEFGILEAGGGWMFHLQPVNYRPHGSFPFEVVRTGNVNAVQRLLDLGQLSVGDREVIWGDGDDVLTVAAFYARLELCDFLLQRAPSLREDAILRRALHQFVKVHSGSGHNSPVIAEQADAMYRLFIGKYGLEVHFDNDVGRQRHTAPASLTRKTSIEDSLLLTEASLRLITESHMLPITQRPFAERFDMAVNTSNWSASLFTDTVNAETTEQLALHMNGRGRTALHWTAEQFGYWLPYNDARGVFDQGYDYLPGQFKQYSRLLTDLLEAGGNISAVTSAYETPLTCMLRALSIRDTGKREEGRWKLHGEILLDSALRQWGVAIAKSGCSLQEYISSETHLQRCFANGGHRYPWRKGGTFGVEELYLLDDSSLGMRIWHETKIQTWKPRLPPGTWPPKEHTLATICWEPTRHERHLWEPHNVHVLRSSPYDLRRQDLSNQLFPGWHSTQNLVKNLLLSTQDDHGSVANLLRGFLLSVEQQSVQDRKSQRHSAAQRSSSLRPHSISDREQKHIIRLIGPDDVTGFGHRIHWFESIHKCLFDNKWKVEFGGGISKDVYDRHKRCMDGACEEEYYHWMWTDFWVARLLKDKDQIDVAKRFISRFWPKAVKTMEFVIGSAKRDDEVRQFLETC